MTTLRPHAELEHLGQDRHRATFHVAPIAYRAAGAYHRIQTAWLDAESETFHHIVTAAPMWTAVAGDGTRRIYPTRELDRYVEVSPPMRWNGGPQPLSWGEAQRQGRRLRWSRPEADLTVDMLGHALKVEMSLQNAGEGQQFAFATATAGLGRAGPAYVVGGRSVMRRRPFVVIDRDNLSDRRPARSSVRNHQGQLYVVVTLPDLAGMSSPVLDPTYESQPDATAGKDAPISQAQPTNNYETLAEMRTGEQNNAASLWRSLIEFDLSSIPSSAIVSSATLSLWLISANLSDNGRTCSVYRLNEAWTESQVTWNNRQTGTAWTTAGAADDAEASAIANKALAAAEAAGEKQFTLDTASVQEWIDGTKVNNGMLLYVDTEVDDCFRWDTSDSVTAGERPKLTIEYTLGNYYSGLFSGVGNLLGG